MGLHVVAAASEQRLLGDGGFSEDYAPLGTAGNLYTIRTVKVCLIRGLHLCKQKIPIEKELVIRS